METAAGKTGRKVEDDRITVGRSEESGLVIPHETLSRRHLSILRKDGAIYIEDLGSSNGTFVNGDKLEPRRRKRVDADDEITMGEADVRLSLSLDAPSDVKPVVAVPSAPAPAAAAPAPSIAPFEKREAPKALREEIETLLSIKATEASELELLRQNVADLEARLNEGRQTLEEIEVQRALVRQEEASRIAAATTDVNEVIDAYLKSLKVDQADIAPLISEVTALLTGDASPPLVDRWQRLQPRLTGALAGIAITLAGVGAVKLTGRRGEEAPVPLRVVAATPAPTPAASPRIYQDSYVDSVLGSATFANTYLSPDFQRRLTRDLAPTAAKSLSLDPSRVTEALGITAELVKSLADKKPANGPVPTETVEIMRRLETEARAQLADVLGSSMRTKQLMDLERNLFER